MKFNSYLKEGPYSGACHKIYYNPASKVVFTNCSIGANFLEVYQGFKDLLKSLDENVECIQAKYLDSTDDYNPNELELFAKIKSKIEDNIDIGDFSGSQRLFELFDVAGSRPYARDGNTFALIYNQDNSICTYSFDNKILRLTGPMKPDQNDNPVKLVDSVYSYNFAKNQPEIFSRINFNRYLSHLIPMLSNGIVQEDFSKYLQSEIAVDSLTNKLVRSGDNKIDFQSTAFELKTDDLSFNTVTSQVIFPFPLEYKYDFEGLEKLNDFITSFSDSISNIFENSKKPIHFVKFDGDICKVILLSNRENIEGFHNEHKFDIDSVAYKYFSFLEDSNLDCKIYI